MVPVKSIVFHINKTARICTYLTSCCFAEKEKKSPPQSIIPDGEVKAGLFTQTTRLNNTCFHRDNRSVWSKQGCLSNLT